MVDEEIVLDTIKKMKDSGLEDSIILSTLQDIGLSEEDAKQYIKRVESGDLKPAPPKPKKTPKQAQAPFSSQQPTAPQSQGNVEKTVSEAMGSPVPPQAQQTQKPQQPTPQAPQQPQAQQAPSQTTTAQTTAQTQQTQRPQPPQPQPAQTQQPTQQPAPDQIADKTAQEVKYHLAEQEEGSEMRHAATQAMLSQQQKTMGKVQDSIKKIEKKTPLKLPADTSPQIKVLMREMELMKGELEETRALTKSTHTLMEKILEVNRKILGRLP